MSIVPHNLDELIHHSYKLKYPGSSFAYIVGFFFSKFDRKALKQLGYTKWETAYNDIGHLLKVKPETIGHNRDAFDRYHPNPRIGHKRNLRRF